MSGTNDINSRAVLDQAAAILRQSGLSGGPLPARDSNRGARGGAFPAIERLARSMGIGEPRVGDMPPQPPTWRGRIGAALVQPIRRALFWYSEQIDRFQQLVASAAGEQLEIGARLQRLEQRVSSLERLESEQGRTAEALEQLASGFKRLDRGMEEFKLLALQQSARLRAQLTESNSSAGAGAAQRLALDDLHLMLRQHAEVFRGDASEIRERLRIYLPYARRACGAGPNGSALDLGCGRGEWLQLLGEEGIPARGIDANPAMAQACRDAGLDVEQADLLEFLRSAPDASASLLSAFHLLEHLAWTDIVEVIDHAVRVLQPGGLAIFEIPNPRNLQVATYRFFLDPTHVHPLPSELLAFLVEARGLREPETLELHPYPDSFRVDGETAVTQLVNQLLFGPQDYAVIAKRP
jgi:SAM-dependent methyltransferase